MFSIKKKLIPIRKTSSNFQCEKDLNSKTNCLLIFNFKKFISITKRKEDLKKNKKKLTKQMNELIKNFQR